MFLFFFFNDTATTEIYTLSLHDALPIYPEEWSANWAYTRVLLTFRRSGAGRKADQALKQALEVNPHVPLYLLDRKSTRLNSSHTVISYAVFCLKKKKISDRAHAPLLMPF